MVPIDQGGHHGAKRCTCYILYCGALNTALTMFHSLRPFLSARLRLIKLLYLQRPTWAGSISCQPTGRRLCIVPIPSPPASGVSTHVTTPSSKSHRRSEPYGIKVILSRGTSLRGLVGCQFLVAAPGIVAPFGKARHQIRGWPREISARPQLCTHPGLSRRLWYI